MLLAAGFAYAPLGAAGFLWDDVHWIQDNGPVRSSEGLRRIWTELDAMPHYYPVVATSFWLEHRLWGDRAAGYHVVNVLLHALNAWLLALLLARLEVPGAGLAALLFAVHPMNAESVAWIVERKNLLAAAFSLLAALAYLAFAGVPAPAPAARRRALYLSSWGLFALALLSKTTAVSLTPALLLVLWWKRRLDRRALLPLVPFFALAVFLGLQTTWVERNVLQTYGPDWEFSPAQRVLIAGRALWFYVGRFVWPTGFMFVYPRWSVDAGALRQWAYPLAAAAALALLFALRGRLGRGPLVGALYYCGASFPTLGFVNFFFMLHSFVSDHFPYLPSFALMAGAGALGTRLVERLRLGTGTAALLAVALALPLGAQTRGYVFVFRSADAVWEDAARKNPGSWLAQTQHGLSILFKGDLAAAEPALAAAVRLRPQSFHTQNGIGWLRLQQHRPAEALAHFRAALRLAPWFPHARLGEGTALAALGRGDEAGVALAHALSGDPDPLRRLRNAGSILANAGAWDAAAAQFERALALDPGSAVLHHDLGRVREAQGRHEEAVRELEEAFRLAPSPEIARDLETARRALADRR